MTQLTCELVCVWMVFFREHGCGEFGWDALDLKDGDGNDLSIGLSAAKPALEACYFDRRGECGDQLERALANHGSKISCSGLEESLWDVTELQLGGAL